MRPVKVGGPVVGKAPVEPGDAKEYVLMQIDEPSSPRQRAHPCCSLVDVAATSISILSLS
jgi:hypothetical protein